MPSTKSPSPTFESIDLAALLDVQGGCGKKCCKCAPQAIAIAAAPAPAPAAPAPLPSSDVSTSVSVSYQ